MAGGQMPLRRGKHAALEAAADELIRQDLVGVTKHSEKSDVLTPWKEAERYRREVYVPSGAPDPSLRRGMYHRAANGSRPEMNSREGITRARRGGNTLQSHVDEYGDSWDPDTT